MIQIAGRDIGEHTKPFVIAEMSGNHNQSLERAIAIVDAAADAGADAIKLQTYTADTITMPGVHRITDEDSLWKGKELHDLYKEAYTPWEWHMPIFDHAKKRGLIAFSSPFDETAVDFLETLDVPAYKIASFENEHYPMIQKIIGTGKPFIMSTGVIDQKNLDESVSFIRECGSDKFILLKCTSSYPASPENTNLRTIPDMQKRYDCLVGLSDHTMGIGASVAAVALGAVVIEKHFTLSRADGGVDSAFSLEPAELRALVVESERAWLALGDVSYTLTEKDSRSMVFKRSIYIARNLSVGHILTHEDIKIIRPAFGLAPKYAASIIGKRVKRNVSIGEPLIEDMIQ